MFGCGPPSHLAVLRSEPRALCLDLLLSERSADRRQAMDATINGDEPWGWKDALEESTNQLNSALWQRGPADEEEEGGGVASVANILRAADIAFQGYRALVVSTHRLNSCC